MKKSGITLIVLFFSVIGLHAQNPSDIIQFGVKGGVNLASLSSDKYENTKMRTAFYAGVLIEIPYSEHFSVQPELIYSAQGGKVKLTDLVTATKQFDYIQIPIMAKYYVAPGLSLQLGPQIGFRVDESLDYNDITLYDGMGIPWITDVKYDKNDIDFSIAAGIGYKFDMGIFLQARYNYGVTDVDPDPIRITNSVIQLGVGYLF